MTYLLTSLQLRSLPALDTVCKQRRGYHPAGFSFRPVVRGIFIVWAQSQCCRHLRVLDSLYPSPHAVDVPT